MIRALAALAGAMLLAPAQQPAKATAILDNATVAVRRQRLAPGAHETIVATGTSLLVVHPVSGPSFVAKGDGYTALNDGPAPLDLLLAAIKPNRASAPAAPPTEAPPGITRTTLIDNADVRVVRVRFAPGSGEPVHTHPNDLLTVQLTPGEFEVLLGTARSGGHEEAGSVRFLPRDVPHAYVSTDSQPFELLSISIK
jgi:quercetin dioxygenase-like cupin family protein